MEKVSSRTFASVILSLIAASALALRSLSPTLRAPCQLNPSVIVQGCLRDPLVDTSIWANKWVARLAGVPQGGAEHRIRFATSICRIRDYHCNNTTRTHATWITIRYQPVSAHFQTSMHHLRPMGCELYQDRSFGVG